MKKIFAFFLFWVILIEALPLYSSITNNEEILQISSENDKFFAGSIVGSGGVIYSFPLVAQPDISYLGSSAVSYVNLSDGVMIKGVYYAVKQIASDGETSSLGQFLSYDVSNWEIISYFTSRDYVYYLAYDIRDDKLYGLNSYNQLVTIDYKTGNITVVGSFPLEKVIGMTFDEESNFYVIALNDTEVADLYKVIDIDNIITEFIASTGVKVEYTYSSFLYDWESDKFYWTVNQSNSNGLYEINVSDATVKAVANFVTRDKFTGLVILEPTEELAPADVETMSFFLEEEALSGKISFIAPTTTQDGSILNGNMTALIYLDNEIYKQVTLSPHTIYESDVISFDQAGSHILRVVISNENGRSRTTTTTFWVGEDVPVAVADLVVTKDDSNNAFISWSAVTEGVHGGNIDKESLRYRIVRLPDNVEVASALDKTEYLDESIRTINAPYQDYTYKVTPYTLAYVGTSTISNSILAGKPLSLPFVKDFRNDDDLSLWTILDLNNDGYKWSYIKGNRSDDPGYLSQPSTYYRQPDDWVFTPLFELEAGGMYKLTLGIESYYREIPASLRVSYGSSTDPASHQVLAIYPNLENGFYTEEIYIFVPADEGGGYHIGFYDYSQVSGGSLRIYDVALEVGATPDSPNAVTDLSISYSEKGQVPAKLSFIAPVLKTSGEPLTELDRIEIYRNQYDTPIHTLTSVSPGDICNWSDEGAKDGSNYYRIIGVNSAGSGVFAIDSVYIGLDPLSAVGNLQLVRSAQDNASLSWEAPTEGLHKGYTTACVYQVIRTDGTNKEVIEESITGTTYIDNTVSKIDQNLYSYIVTPCYLNVSDSYGESSQSNIIRFGSAYIAPYAESFSNTSYDKPGWNSELVSGKLDGWNLSATLTNTTFSAQDNDRGVAMCDVDGFISTSLLSSPIIDLSGLDSPLLRFWFTHYDYSLPEDTYMIVTISTDAGQNFEPLSADTIHVKPSRNSHTVLSDWTLYEFSLADYKSCEIMIGFEVTQSAIGVAIDNISVIEKPDHDLKILSFDPPSRLFAGHSNDFTLTLKNSGKQPTSSYLLKLYKGNEVISSLPGEVINPEEVREITISPSYTNFANDEIGTAYLFYVEAEFAEDELQLDNVSQEKSILVERSIYSGVPELRGIQEETGIILEWDVPDSPKTPVPFEEGFEVYEPFIIDNIGDWTLIDEDRMSTVVMGQNYFNLWKYENVGLPMAYQVFNTKLVSATPLAGQNWDAYTGNQNLACFVQIENTDPNDDWLISPELNGSAQEIIFYARGANPNTTNPERFVVYASSTGKEISDFSSLIDGAFQEAATSWTQYRYTLPEGSRYFAIRCVSENALTFLLDDICFAKGGDALTVSGYNVYRNDVKLNTSILPVGTTEYVDESPIDGGKTYTVTAVYSSGESNYSNELRFDYVGISDDVLDSILVYSPVAGEIIIEGAEYLMIQIIGIDGSLVHRSLGSGFDKISLLSGSYIVKVGQKVTKVIVK